MEADLGETRLAELGGDILGCRSTARRPPGMRPERGQRRGVLERRPAVDRRDEKQRQGPHARGQSNRSRVLDFRLQ